MTTWSSTASSVLWKPAEQPRSYRTIINHFPCLKISLLSSYCSKSRPETYRRVFSTRVSLKKCLILHTGLLRFLNLKVILHFPGEVPKSQQTRLIYCIRATALRFLNDAGITKHRWSLPPSTKRNSCLTITSLTQKLHTLPQWIPHRNKNM